MGCPRTVRELSVGCLWASHGLSTNYPRAARELTMNCPRNVLELPLTFHGLLVGYPLAVSELCIGCPWTVRGPSMAYSRAFHGLFTGYPLSVRGLSENCLWAVGVMYAPPMGFPWALQGLTMRCPRPVNGCPKVVDGLATSCR